MSLAEGERQELRLSEAARTLVEECRMVLPGVQAIFGFQLIAVFQQKFGEELDKPYQYLHLSALTLVAIAAAVIMTPAAYHRIRNPREVTERFIRVSSRLRVRGDDLHVVRVPALERAGVGLSLCV